MKVERLFFLKEFISKEHIGVLSVIVMHFVISKVLLFLPNFTIMLRTLKFLSVSFDSLKKYWKWWDEKNLENNIFKYFFC